MDGESHTYKKSMYGKNSSVNIDASAESIDELKTILQDSILKYSNSYLLSDLSHFS